MAIKKVKYSINRVDTPFRENGVNTTNVKNISSEFISEGTLYRRRELVEFDFSNTLVSDLNYSTFIQAIPSAENIINYQTQMASPHSNEQAVDNSDYSSLTYGIKAVYNYHAPQYEEVIENMEETKLINAYVSSKNGNSDGLGGNRHFQNTSITKDSFLNISRRSHIRYEAASSISTQSEIIYPQKYNFLDIEPFKKKFPFAIDMSIGVDVVNNKFKNFLKKTDMYEIFVQGYNLLPKDMVTLNTTVTSNIGATSGAITLKYLDLMNLDLSVMLSIGTSSTGGYFNPSRSPSSTQGMGLKLALLKGFMRQLTIEEMPTLKDVIMGRKNYYEPIFYKIQKTVGVGGGQITQTYIVPANKNILNYFDTQIKAGVIYSYKITECAIVMGNRMTTISSGDLGVGNKAQFEFENEPILYLMETPIVRDAVATICNPTPPPSIDFYTKNDASDRIFMRMHTTGVGQVVDDFHEIFDEDVRNSEMLRYKNMLFDKYVYENKNNKIESYEIIRLSSRPQRLSDFANGVRYVIDEKIFFNSTVVSSEIKANKKYYYICRSINQHGMISNHSSIYEVELLRGASTSRLEVNLYSFDNKPRTSQFRNMTRLLQLVPASQHTIYQLPDEGDSYKRYLNRTTLGQAGLPIWGEKFKIRVTSNNTGRKIDFNVVFNLIKNKTPEEIK